MAIVVPIVSEWNPSGLDKATADIGKAKGGWAKTGAGFRSALLPATAVLGGIGLAAKGWVSQAGDARKSTAALNKVFTDMGDTTGANAKAASDYADTLSAQIGVDDDVIRQTEAKLATFSAISGEVGRTSGMFDRATAAAHDLAAAGFGDAASNAVQLGKALQDPVKGTKALAKSGITFTKAEQDKIKALTKSGDLLGAQKIVMKAVETQVKGVAAATASSSDKMSVAWGNAQEALGTVLLPAIDAFASKLASVAAFVQDHARVVMILVGVLATLAAIVITVNAAMKAYQAMMAIVRAATLAWTAVQWALNAAMTANPIGLVILAVVALIAVIVILWKRSQTFRTIVLAVWAAILAAIKAVVAFVRTVAVAMWSGVSRAAVATGNAIRAAWNGVKAFLVGVWNWISRAGATVWNSIRNAAASVTGTIKGLWQGLWNFVSSIFRKIESAWNSIKGFLGKVPGVGHVLGFSATGATSYTAAYPASSLFAPVPRSGSTSSTGLVVNVYATVDPTGTARAVQRLLGNADIRTGRRRFA